MNMRKIGIRILISLVILAAYLGWRMGMSENEDATLVTDQAQQIGSHFTLTNQFGEQVSSDEFRGKYMLVFFGFTNCPDICPTTLLALTNVLNALGEEANEFAPIFISVDPDRDTPEVIKLYLDNFDKRFVGLTGTEAEVNAVADGFKVYHALERKEGVEDYNVAHSGFVYVMNREGQYIKHFAAGTSEKEMTESLEKIAAE